MRNRRPPSSDGTTAPARRTTGTGGRSDGVIPSLLSRTHFQLQNHVLQLHAAETQALPLIGPAESASSLSPDVLHFQHEEHYTAHPPMSTPVSTDFLRRRSQER